MLNQDSSIASTTLISPGTRVSVKTLLDYLEAGDALDEFLYHFPSVSREQTIAALELAKEMLIAQTNSARRMCSTTSKT